jgi:hypothetical protein
MDDTSLNRELASLCQKAVLEARAAVDSAPNGQWIAGSEWEVHGVFQRLKRDCYQLMLQARADSHPSAGQADFSPSAGRDSAEQGRAASPGAERRRRG